jgi:hypothetical protein
MASSWPSSSIFTHQPSPGWIFDHVMTPARAHSPMRKGGNDPGSLVGGPQTYLFELQESETIIAMAKQWAEDLDTIAVYLEMLKSDFVKNTGENLPASKNASVSHGLAKCLRDGGEGNGREEYDSFRHRLVDLGSRDCWTARRTSPQRS